MSSLQKYHLEDLLPIKNKLVFLIGKPGTGKTKFCKLLLQHIDLNKVYLHVRDREEWHIDIQNKAHFSNVNPLLSYTEFNYPADSIIIVDDYSHSQSEKGIENFLNIINFSLSHHNLTLIINIQTYYKNKLFSIVFQNSFIFVTYCKFNTLTLKNIDKQLDTNFKEIFIQNYETGEKNFHIGFLNLANSYFIPFADQLYNSFSTPLKMYKNNKVYYIFDSENVQINFKKNSTEKNDIGDFLKKQDELVDTIQSLYPKQNAKIILLSNQLFKHLSPYMDEQYEIRINNVNLGNFLDFLKNSQNPNPDFKLDKTCIMLLKWLRKNNVKIAKLFYKNKTFNQYLNPTMTE